MPVERPDPSVRDDLPEVAVPDDNVSFDLRRKTQRVEAIAHGVRLCVPTQATNNSADTLR